MPDVHNNLGFLIGRKSKLIQVVDVHAGGDGSEAEGVSIEVDVLCGHADFGHGVFFIGEDGHIPDHAELDGGTRSLTKVEVIAGFEENEAVVLGVVGVGVVAADDVDDGGVDAGGAVDGTVAVGGDAVAGPEDGGEFLVGEVLASVGADGHASAD